MKEARFKLSNEQDSEKLLQSLSAYFGRTEDKPLVAVITEFKPARTTKQRKALHGYAYPILVEETGSDVDEFHEYFCGLYFGWVEYEFAGQQRKRPKRTTTKDENGFRDVVSTRDHAKLFELVVDVASRDFGIYIPDPDPDYKKNIAAQIAAEEEEKAQVLTHEETAKQAEELECSKLIQQQN